MISRPNTNHRKPTRAEPAAAMAAKRELPLAFRKVRQWLAEIRGAQTGHAVAVHQLRVSTRRAAAAIALFRPVLSDSFRRKARRLLRKIRRRAATVRDWDVFLENAKKAIPLRADALKVARQFRQDNFVRLVNHAARKYGGAFTSLSAELTKQLRSLPREVNLRELGRERLRKLREEGRFVVSSSAPSELHQTRIAVKRLRYALEILRDYFPSLRMTAAVKAMKQSQKLLGVIQDYEQMGDRLNDIQKSDPTQTAALRQFRSTFQKKQSQATTAFRREWKKSSSGLFDDDILE